MDKRKIAYMDNIKSIIFKKEDVPKLQEKEVLVKVRSVGICGSDLVYYTKGGSAVAKIEYPHILGHELSGEIVSLGNKVKGLSIGDRVAVEPGVPCYRCDYCKEGNYNLCNEMSFMSTPIKRKYSEGGFVEYSVRPYEMLHKIPENISFNEGAMIEPLAVALNALDQSKVKSGDKVLILGSGPIAMCILLSLRAVGVNCIYTTDIKEERVSFSKEMGSLESFNVLNTNFVEEIENLIGENQIDAIYDTTCHEGSINDALSLAKKNSSITLIGVPHGEFLNINAKTLFLKQITMFTSFRYANQYPKAINLVASGAIEIDKIITNYFQFDEIKEALELALSNNGDIMKIVVNN